MNILFLNFIHHIFKMRVKDIVKILPTFMCINVSSKTVDQSEEPGGGATIARFCLQ